MTERGDQATRGLIFKTEALQYPSPLLQSERAVPSPKLAWKTRMSPETAVFDRSGSHEIMLAWGRVCS